MPVPVCMEETDPQQLVHPVYNILSVNALASKPKKDNTFRDIVDILLCIADKC